MTTGPARILPLLPRPTGWKPECFAAPAPSWRRASTSLSRDNNSPRLFYDLKAMVYAAERNKGPILEVLKGYLGDGTPRRLLEVASGDGTHTAHLGRALPNVTFQPTEYDKSMLSHIVSNARGMKNVLKPISLDVSKPDEAVRDLGGEEGAKFDCVFCANLVHISPYSCTVGLFRLSGSVLPAGGRLFTYGPYAENGVLTPESNVNFDKMLKGRDPQWGIRDIKDLSAEAAKNGMELEKRHDMPANNKILVWRKK